MNRLPLEEVLLSLESGARPKGGVSADSGEIPSVGGEHLTADGGFDFSSIKHIPESFFNCMKAGRIARHDILIVKDGATTGKTSFVTHAFPYELAAVNEHVFCVRVDPHRACPAYVFHFLISAEGQRAIRLDFRGATVGGISRDFSRKTRVPLPTLPEQRRIAAILDKANELRAKRRVTLAQFDAAAQAVFEDIFGGAATAAHGTVQLGEVLSFVTSGSRGWAEFYMTSGKRFIRSLDVQMNRISDDDAVYVNPPDTAESRRTRVESGDVLLTITGSRIGRVAAVPDALVGAHISQHVAILRPIPTRIVPEFLAFFLSLSGGGQRQIAVAQYGQTKPGLNFEQIKGFRIPFPALALQQEFCRRLAMLEHLKSQQQRSLVGFNTLFACLQHSVFAGAL
jgi:type I restriction enzyme S subunit